VLQFLCDAAKDTGKEEYLRPFIRIGLDLTVSNKRPLDLIAPYHGEHLEPMFPWAHTSLSQIGSRLSQPF